MPKIIGKFPLEIADRQLIDMPQGAEILTVQLQNELPNLWAVIDTDKPKESVEIETFGTGHPMDDRLRRYIGTYQMRGGTLVFHVFEPEI